MIRAGIVGVTGYAGETLLELLLGHRDVSVTHLSAKIAVPQKISQIFPRFKKRIDLICGQPDLGQIQKKSDLVFLALPHSVSQEIAPKLIKAGKRVIDLSADYRLKDPKLYQDFYKIKHKDKPNLKTAVYGLPELYRNKIKGALLVANPGCYPTAAILALAPLVALKIIDPDSIVIDAKSGVTGAGRKVAEGFLFSEINEDFKAYKVNIHQHMPEINQVLSGLAVKKVKVIFVPHLLPLNRGILETIYVNQLKDRRIKARDLVDLYRKFYQKELFVRIKAEGENPRLKEVVGTNFCDIGLQVFSGKLIIVAAIDNLLKGASGQAVQNMNIMYKIPENTALA